MDDRIYKLARGPALSVPLEDADKLLSGADGLSALLYLYILRRSGAATASEAAAELNCGEREIAAAFGRLASLGLLDGQASLIAAEPPEYKFEEFSRRSDSDDMFKFIVAETQRVFGRMLSGTELKTIFAFYDHLALPCEVILTLINYCVEEAKERYGDNRLPTMRQIEKEAYIWSDREILSLERAEEYIRRQSDRKDSVAGIKGVLQISGRDMSSSEKKYVESWLEMGFAPETVEIAYDRTIIQTGKLTWKYLDTILNSWHNKGLHSPQEVRDGDSQHGRASKYPENAKTPDSPQPGELERLKKTLNKVSNT